MKFIIIFILSLFIQTANANSRENVVIAAMNNWNDSLSDSIRTEKYCKMKASEFVFYRGTNHLFWQDLALHEDLNMFSNNNTKIWLQADLHTNNYGAYDNDNGTIVYGLNDFDESIIADYQYDVWRLAISLVLVARENGGFSHGETEDIIDKFSESYLDTLSLVRGNKTELETIFTKDNTYGRLDDFLTDTKNDNSRSRMLKKWTTISNGKRVLDSQIDDLESISPSLYQQIEQAMPAYGNSLSGSINYDSAYFSVKSIARRLHAGVGSLGVARFYILIEGESSDQDDDRILDVKLQSIPSAYYFLSNDQQLDYDRAFINDAQRHQLAYQALTKHTDDHLGVISIANEDYSVRERSPYKETFSTSELDSNTRFQKLAEQWGTILAMSHARSDKDFDSDYISYSFDKAVDELVDGHHSQFREIIRRHAFDYANQVTIDYQLFLSHLAPQQCSN